MKIVLRFLCTTRSLEENSTTEFFFISREAANVVFVFIGFDLLTKDKTKRAQCLQEFHDMTQHGK